LPREIITSSPASTFASSSDRWVLASATLTVTVMMDAPELASVVEQTVICTAFEILDDHMAVHRLVKPKLYHYRYAVLIDG
jgi:hypothetical protein